jgi:hypothetical protein
VAINVSQIVLGRKIREKHRATTTFWRHDGFHKPVMLTILSNQEYIWVTFCHRRPQLTSALRPQKRAGEYNKN